MKNYFDFTLTGKKFFPVWILFIVLMIVPYGIMLFKAKEIQPGEVPDMMFFIWPVALFFVAFILTFYMARLLIEGIVYDDKAIVFNGTFGEYMVKVLLGFFLSIITLGIYIPWFTKDITGFFVDNSSCNSETLKFKGKGGKLFVIITLSFLLPIIIMTIIMAVYVLKDIYSAQLPKHSIVTQLLMTIIMIPYIYLFYKWMVNVDYKDFNIRWETNFWDSCWMVAGQMLLSIVTIGIYYPMAVVRLYKYFLDRTVAVSDERRLNFGYDIEASKDFLFLWGQILLIIITLSIYYPWALCKIGKRFLSKTYLADSKDNIA
ncbi:MAG: hypothetical protein A2X18_00995 [Bacteroidetes bacterium GWF2_40_14]|nr:MAG: hypothetical protein A2X18_00995 [Bacteroidetes bacterium GWF2_40_14]